MTEKRNSYWIAWLMMAAVTGTLCMMFFAPPRGVPMMMHYTCPIVFAFVGMNTFLSILYPIAIIGLVSFVLSVIGNLLGVFFGKHMHLRTEILGGVILIAIGTKILFEHLQLI